MKPKNKKTCSQRSSVHLVEYIVIDFYDEIIIIMHC